MQSVSPRALGITVFLAGTASLATEMSASRLVAPYFGSSNVVWANVIGLMLAFLALGYWLGGKIADARPKPRLLAAILLASALTLAVVPFAFSYEKSGMRFRRAASSSIVSSDGRDS